MKDSRTFEQIYVGLITEDNQQGFIEKTLSDYMPIMSRFNELRENPLQEDLDKKFAGCVADLKSAGKVGKCIGNVVDFVDKRKATVQQKFSQACKTMVKAEQTKTDDGKSTALSQNTEAIASNIQQSIQQGTKDMLQNHNPFGIKLDLKRKGKGLVLESFRQRHINQMISENSHKIARNTINMIICESEEGSEDGSELHFDVDSKTLLNLALTNAAKVFKNSNATKDDKDAALVSLAKAVGQHGAMDSEIKAKYDKIQKMAANDKDIGSGFVAKLKQIPGKLKSIGKAICYFLLNLAQAIWKLIAMLISAIFALLAMLWQMRKPGPKLGFSGAYNKWYGKLTSEKLGMGKNWSQMTFWQKLGWGIVVIVEFYCLIKGLCWLYKKLFGGGSSPESAASAPAASASAAQEPGDDASSGNSDNYDLTLNERRFRRFRWA